MCCHPGFHVPVFERSTTGVAHQARILQVVFTTHHPSSVPTTFIQCSAAGGDGPRVDRSLDEWMT